MSTEIELGQLRAENAQQKATIEALRKESAKYRTDRSGKLKGAETQVAELQAELDKIKKEHGKALKTIEELPKETQLENEKLRGELRTRDHRAKFNELAAEAKADPKALDALWKLSDYKPDTDEVNVESLKEAITKTLDSNPFMRAAAEQRHVVQPGPGGGQGGRPSNVTGSWTCTEDQYRDPNYVRTHYADIQKAAVAGLLTVKPTIY